MSHFLFEYDNRYDPPAPVANIHLQGIGKDSQQVQIVALIDSGADGTMVPEPILKRIGAKLQDTAQMRGVNQIVRRVKLYDLRIQVGDQWMRSLAVAMPAGSEAIIGRDILNQLKITLDGFSNYTSIETLIDD